MSNLLNFNAVQQSIELLDRIQNAMSTSGLRPEYGELLAGLFPKLEKQINELALSILSNNQELDDNPDYQILIDKANRSAAGAVSAILSSPSEIAKAIAIRILAIEGNNFVSQNRERLQSILIQLSVEENRHARMPTIRDQIVQCPPCSNMVTFEDLLIDKAEILPNLYLGRADAEGEFDIVVLATSPNNLDPKFSTVNKYEMPLDGLDVSIESFKLDGQIHLQNALRVIDQSLQESKNILVCCQQGKDRSALILTAYIMKKFDVTAAEAVNFIKSKRPIVTVDTKVPNTPAPYWDFLTQEFDVNFLLQPLDAQDVNPQLEEKLVQEILSIFLKEDCNGSRDIDGILADLRNIKEVIWHCREGSAYKGFKSMDDSIKDVEDQLIKISAEGCCSLEQIQGLKNALLLHKTLTSQYFKYASARNENSSHLIALNWGGFEERFTMDRWSSILIDPYLNKIGNRINRMESVLQAL